MQITYINSFNPYNSNKYSANTPKSSAAFKSNASFDTFLKTFGKLKYFTTSEYKQLTAREINLINKNIDKLFADTPDFYRALKYHDIVAEGMRQNLNNSYGEGNYIVIPIGRSLSSIGKCLGYKIGEGNIKLLPMSRAGRFCNYFQENIELFCQYLESIGLSKNDVENSEKKYIFTDYCCSGDSLQGAKHLFESEEIYGDNDNLIFIDVLQLLDNVQPNQIRDDLSWFDDIRFTDNLKNMLRKMEFKKYSLVNSCLNLGYTKEAVIKPEHYRDDAKCFWFKLMDYEIKKS